MPSNGWACPKKMKDIIGSRGKSPYLIRDMGPFSIMSKERREDDQKDTKPLGS